MVFTFVREVAHILGCDVGYETKIPQKKKSEQYLQK